MLRSVLILNNPPCPTPFVTVVFPFWVISAALTPGRIITGLSRLAFWDLLETGDGGLAGPDDPGLEPLKTTCDH